VEIANSHADLDHALDVERLEPDLRRARVEELGVAGEVGGEALREWGQPLDAVRAIEELRRACDQHVETRVAPAVEIVDELAQRVQALLAVIAAHALDRLDLVQDEQEALAPGLAQDLEQPAQEARGRVGVKITLDL